MDVAPHRTPRPTGPQPRVRRHAVGPVALAVCGLMLSACAGLAAPVSSANLVVDPTTGAQLTTAQRDEIVARHNVYRAEVGEAPLVWDATIAAGAQQWADAKQADGTFEHSTWDSRPGLGENLAGGPLEGATDRLAADERVLYQTDPQPVDQPPGNWTSWGHYSQIVWSTTTRVGCGFAARGNLPYDLVVCRYAGPGNFSGEYPYPPDTVLVAQPGLAPVTRAGAVPADPTVPDTGQPEAGQPDAGQPDAGQPEAGQPDAGQPDAGQPDAGQPDAGQPDAGQPDAGGTEMAPPEMAGPAEGAPQGGPDGAAPPEKDDAGG
ncbi:CAP domain-containing protein [Pseudonocardia sp.]|uniref:CAP domain-containing protein n=1 Tax=Pseudonocardia sp. TaxID=60912 RepID=UPI003D141E49